MIEHSRTIGLMLKGNHRSVVEVFPFHNTVTVYKGSDFVFDITIDKDNDYYNVRSASGELLNLGTKLSDLATFFSEKEILSIGWEV